jgi:hypothetical protein
MVAIWIFLFQKSLLKTLAGFLEFFKGQLISKVIYGLLTSPKKQTNEFVLFAFLLFTTNKSNSSVRFLGESMDQGVH